MFIGTAMASVHLYEKVSSFFLPNHRYSITAYAERFFWARYNELADDGVMDMMWERTHQIQRSRDRANQE